MSKTKLEKIDAINLEIEQLKNRQKLLRQQHSSQERKARTKRLCSRGGYLESRLPETVTLTDEQYKVLLEKTLFGERGRTILDWVKDKNITGVEVNPETQKRQVILDNGETYDI